MLGQAPLISAKSKKSQTSSPVCIVSGTLKVARLHCWRASTFIWPLSPSPTIILLCESLCQGIWLNRWPNVSQKDVIGWPSGMAGKFLFIIISRFRTLPKWPFQFLLEMHVVIRKIVGLRIKFILCEYSLQKGWKWIFWRVCEVFRFNLWCLNVLVVLICYTT